MIESSTIAALRRAKIKAKNGSLRSLARDLNISAAALSDLLDARHNHVGLAAENRVRVALGLPAIPPPIIIVRRAPPPPPPAWVAAAAAWLREREGQSASDTPHCYDSRGRLVRPA